MRIDDIVSFMSDTVADVEAHFAENVLDSDADKLLTNASCLTEMFAINARALLFVECTEVVRETDATYVVQVSMTHDYVCDARAEFDATIFLALQFAEYDDARAFALHMLSYSYV